MAVAPLFVGNQINQYVVIGALLIFLGLIFINIRKKVCAT
jgi:drug/metabolite transporter (DMT)-like permease